MFAIASHDCHGRTHNKVRPDSREARVDQLSVYTYDRIKRVITTTTTYFSLTYRCCCDSNDENRLNIQVNCMAL